MRCVVVLLAVFGLGCLPDDLREPPAEVLVTIEPSLATREGFYTTTGWYVGFEQVALNIGRVGFPDDENCTYYSFTQYSWLIDMTEARREKVGIAHALGDCRLRFDAPAVDPDVVRLGVGANETMVDLMDYELSIAVLGYASRGEEVIPFGMGTTYLSFGPCLDGFGSTSLATSNLASGQAYDVPLLFDAEALLSTLSSPGSSDLDFSTADSDDNGLVDGYEIFQALVASGDATLEAEVAGYQLSTVGNALRLRDGGPCLLVDPADQGFSPF